MQNLETSRAPIYEGLDNLLPINKNNNAQRKIAGNKVTAAQKSAAI
jgi:hypothetical protein